MNNVMVFPLPHPGLNAVIQAQESQERPDTAGEGFRGERMVYLRLPMLDDVSQMSPKCVVVKGFPQRCINLLGASIFCKGSSHKVLNIFGWNLASC